MTQFWDSDKATVLDLTPEDFVVTREMPTRWRDNDSQGHVNNAVYYEYFDTAINGWLHHELGDRSWPDEVLEFVAESACKFLGEFAFPTPLVIAHRVSRIGRSSATYEIGLFPVHGGVPGSIAALGRWVHVYVDAETRRPTVIPAVLRAILETGTATGRTVRESI